MNINTFFKCWAAVLIGAIIYIVLFAGDVQAAETVTAAPVVTLQQSLVAIIQQVQSGVSAGVSFLQQEIPDVIRQLLLWNLVKSATITFFCLLILGAFAYGNFPMYRMSQREDDIGFSILYAIFAGIFIAAPAAIFGVQYLLNALQIWIAPKVWLIEYASQLVK